MGKPNRWVPEKHHALRWDASASPPGLHRRLLLRFLARECLVALARIHLDGADDVTAVFGHCAGLSSFAPVHAGHRKSAGGGRPTLRAATDSGVHRACERIQIARIDIRHHLISVLFGRRRNRRVVQRLPTSRYRSSRSARWRMARASFSTDCRLPTWPMSSRIDSLTASSRCCS